MSQIALITLRPLFAFMHLVEREWAPTHIAAGVVLGFAVGLTPYTTLQWGFFVLLTIILRTQPLAIFFSGIFAFSLQPIIDPLFHQIGNRVLLTSPSLRETLSWMYHLPVVPFTVFNNSVVMGSLIIFTIASFPAYLLLHYLLKRYWTKIENFKGTQVWISFSCTRVHRIYVDYRRSQSNEKLFK